MQSFRISILLSILLHITIIGLITLYLQNRFRIRPPETLTVYLTAPETKPQKIIGGNPSPAMTSAESAVLPRRTNLPEPVYDVKASEIPANQDETEKQPDAWVSFLKEGEPRVALLNETAKKDSTQIPKPTMRPIRIGKMTSGRQDPVGDAILRKNTGISPSFPNLTPVAESEKKTARPLILDFIPTNTQLCCLSRLMEQDSLTDTELYPLLEGSGNTSFDNYRKEMDDLVEKGLVVREKVSPVQTFSFFGFPIEMSAKNRRNPEFRYKPHLGRKKLYTFLEARLYGAKEQLKANPADSVRIRKQIEILTEKLALITPVSK